jgi:parallel beta-helix repeat protein
MMWILKLAAACLSLAGLASGATHSYAVERHVNPNHQASEDAGSGSSQAPYRSLSHAMSQLQPGDHLIIAAGVYRDALLLPERNWASADTLIEGQGRVLIKGSDEVKDWKPLGDGRFVTDWPKEAAQVFIDGKALQQIGGTVFDGYPTKTGHSLQNLHRSQGGIWPGRKSGNEATMPPESFYFSDESKSLFVRLSGEASPGRVEVSVRAHLLFGRNLDRITVRNISFAHGNSSPAGRAGLLSLSGNRLRIDGVQVALADSIGIHLIGDDISLSNSSANECGQLGINARGRRMRLENNETSGNNTRGFNKWWEAGGIKLVGDGGLQDSTVIGHKSFGNNGDGIWFDWKNNNNRIENSVSAYNSGMGIHYEASSRAVITGNVVIGNGQRGIYLLHSSDSEASHNIVAGNMMQGIVVMDEGARDPQGTDEFRARRNRVYGNIVAWNAAALFFPAELDDNRSDANFYVGTPLQMRFSLGWPRRSSDRLHEWTNRTGQDRSSKAHEAEIDPAFVKSVAERRRQPSLEWIKTMRAAETLRMKPEWAVDAPGNRSGTTQ